MLNSSLTIPELVLCFKAKAMNYRGLQFWKRHKFEQNAIVEASIFWILALHEAYIRLTYVSHYSLFTKIHFYDSYAFTLQMHSRM